MRVIAANNAKGDQQTRKNEEIRCDEVMLIDSDGNNIGTVPTSEALDQAYEDGLDLVEVSPNAQPPVCRIMDYGKFLYDKQKKEKEKRKNSKARQMKEMKFRCNIGSGDYETKRRHIIKFLESGSPVRITIMFRGREMSHSEIGMEILDKLTKDLEGLCVVQAPPKMEGRNMTMTVAPAKK